MNLTGEWKRDHNCVMVKDAELGWLPTPITEKADRGIVIGYLKNVGEVDVHEIVEVE